MSRKWRPPLALVIGGTLAAFLCLPLVGIAYFRLAGNILGWGETSLLLGTLALMATCLLGFLLWRLVLRPVWSITRFARAARFGPAVAPTQFGTPELHDLAQAVTEMGATLNGRADQLRAYADHVTHELKSPLTALRGASEMLANDPDAQTRAALLQSVKEATERMAHLLEDLQRHARASQSSGPGKAQLGPVARELGIDVLADGDVPLAKNDLRAVLTQLAQNARQHGASDVTVTLGDGWMEIEDNGSGIARGDAERLFDPFFTTRRDSGGTGMGLSIVRSLLQASGADISLRHSDKGATFRIIFPQM